MKNYKVAMVITDSFHSDIEGKNYKFGTPNKLNKTSKPLILFYFVQDYKRTWDEANPLNYDDPQLKNDAIVTKIESEGDVLNISLFDYESLDETELRFEVGKETSVSKVVDENDHTKEYKFIPTKIVVADSLEKGSKVYDELIETVWTNYYIKNSKEGEKIPKVAENVETEFDFIHCSNCLFSKTGLNRCEVCNTEFVCRSQHGEDCNCYLFTAEGHSHNKSSYKKCAECSDSVFELEEEICFECSSFGAETFDAEHRVLSYVDGHAITILMTDDEATIDNAEEIIDNLVDEHGFDDYYEVGEGDKEITIYFEDVGGNTLRTLSYDVKGNKANDAIMEWFYGYDYPVGGYTANAENNNGWAYHVYVSNLEEYVDEDGDSLIDLTKQQIVHLGWPTKESAIEAANNVSKDKKYKKYDVVYVVAEKDGDEEIVYRIQNGEVSYSAETFNADDGKIMKEVRLRIDEEGTQFTPTWAIEKKIPILYDDEGVLADVVFDMAENAQEYAIDHNERS